MVTTTPELNKPVGGVLTPEAKAQMTEADRKANIEELTKKRDEFVDRLDTGAAKIEEARAQGKDVNAWENHWINLLRQYERVCDRLRELQAKEEFFKGTSAGV